MFFYDCNTSVSAAGSWTFNTYVLRQERFAVTESTGLLRPDGVDMWKTGHDRPCTCKSP